MHAQQICWENIYRRFELCDCAWRRASAPTIALGSSWRRSWLRWRRTQVQKKLGFVLGTISRWLFSLFVNRMDFFVCVCSVATNIFIRGEEQGQLTNEIRILWGQNQALKEQLSMGSKGQTHARIISNRLIQLNLYTVLSINTNFWNSLQTSRKRTRS